MEKVSIIIPVYNMESYLEQCLESVVNQTYSNLEIVVVDDGSSDKSPEICDEYAKRYKRMTVYHKKNGGLCSARNYGIEHCTGEWILFVDSDDWCDTEYVQKLMGPNGERKKYDVVMSSVYAQAWNMEFHLEMGTYTCEGEYNNPEEMKMLHALTIGNTRFWRNNFSSNFNNTAAGVGCPWDKLYKREIIAQRGLRFDERTRVFEDIIFNMHYFEFVKNVYYVDARGYYYRFVGNSITKKPDLSRLKKEYYFLQHVEEYSRMQVDNAYFEEAKKMRVLNLMRNLGKLLAYAGETMTYVQIKREIHEYLQQPMIKNSLKSMKLSEVKGGVSKIAIFLARNEMIFIMRLIYKFGIRLRTVKQV